MHFPSRVMLALAALIAQGPSRADDPPRCSRDHVDGGWGSFRVRSGVARGKVRFQSEAKACSPDAKCPWLEKSYLVPGDVVLAGPEVHGFRCSIFGTAKGKAVNGFLPMEALESAPAKNDLDAAFLSGTWSNDEYEAEITFTPGEGKKVKAEGAATWRGPTPTAVHVGEMEGEAEPRGDVLTYGDPGEDGCRVTIQRRGPFLQVEDNGKCGGMNVTFSGLYAKQRK
jgi:hypothetical protein